jgi:sterol-4alpha-carboxylate 3-dehydrogenase (decarboxylating)
MIPYNMPPGYGTPNRTPPAPPPTQKLGTTLVIGGCGFLGYFLVAKLLVDRDCGLVVVVDKDVSRNIHDTPQVRYIEADLTDEPGMAQILDRMEPEVIFHCASPNATYERRGGFFRGQFYHTNVVGTEIILRLAKQRPFVKALVYTSSSLVYKGGSHVRLRETSKTFNARPWPWQPILEYRWTKGVAHNMVLDNNESWRGGGLATCAIVPANIYGLRDSQALPLMFDAFGGTGKPIFKIGKGENMASFVEVSNCADMHVLAAKCLVEGRKDVGGQAFNATDGNDVPLWWHMGATCAAIRGEADEPSVLRVRTIPAWCMWVATHVVWLLLAILTLGYMEPPPAFSVEGYWWCTKTRTYDIRKAKRRLGYNPQGDSEWHDEIVQAAVAFEKDFRRLEALRLVAEEQERARIASGAHQKTK